MVDKSDVLPSDLNESWLELKQATSEMKRAYDYFKSLGYTITFSETSQTYYRSYPKDGQIVTEPLTGDYSEYIDYYINDFLPAWGANDWTISYLQSFQTMQRKDGSTVDMIPYIFTDIVNVQAGSQEELESLIAMNKARLSKVEPSVELSGTEVDFTLVFNTEARITEAKASGELVNTATRYIDESQDMFVRGELKGSLDFLDESLAAHGLNNISRSSSGARSLDVQTVLGLLGFPAVELSNHNFGNALDLALSNTSRPFIEFKNRFPQLLEALADDQQEALQDLLKVQNGEISFSQLYKIYVGYYDNNKKSFIGKKILLINQLALDGTPISMANLIKLGILTENDPVVSLYRVLLEAKGIEILDETPFFSILTFPVQDDAGEKDVIKSKVFNPNFHCQAKTN